MDWEDSIDVYKTEYTANQQTKLEAISKLFTWMKQKNKVAVFGGYNQREKTISKDIQ